MSKIKMITLWCKTEDPPLWRKNVWDLNHFLYNKNVRIVLSKPWRKIGFSIIIFFLFKKLNSFLNIFWVFPKWLIELAEFSDNIFVNTESLNLPPLVLEVRIPLQCQRVRDMIFKLPLIHRSDSHKGTGTIANDFFLNWGISRTKVENLKW